MTRGSAPRVVFGNINPGSLRLETVGSLIESWYQKKVPGVETKNVILQPSGPYLDDARNKVCDEFLKTDGDALLFVDSDIQFDPEHVSKLVTWAAKDPQRRGVASGTYVSNIDGVFVAVAYHLGEGRHGPKTYLPILGSDIMKSRRTPIKVDGVGAGFMLIQRHVLEAMFERFNYPQPWFAELVVQGGRNGVHLGEDLTFCARAQSLGFPIWLHRGVRVKHYKTLGLVP